MSRYQRETRCIFIHDYKPCFQTLESSFALINIYFTRAKIIIIHVIDYNFNFHMNYLKGIAKVDTLKNMDCHLFSFIIIDIIIIIL